MWGLKRLRARETSVDELIGNQVEEHKVLIECPVLLNEDVIHTSLYTSNILLA